MSKATERSFEPGGLDLQGGLKDVNLMLEAAGDVHVPLPMANILRDRLLTAMIQDMGERDWALTEIIRQSTNID
jgi:3-hydroxyisobutyrate dehydrogenase-like beta-hydroxyacid dehydrogenase